MENNSLAICLGIRTLVDNDVKICLRRNRLARLATWTTVHFANKFEKYFWKSEIDKMREGIYFQNVLLIQSFRVKA